MDAADLGPIAVGFTAVIQFVWAVYLMLTEDGTEGTSTGSSFLDDESSSLCLDRACEQDVFKFLNARVLQSATFQVFFPFAILCSLQVVVCSSTCGIWWWRICIWSSLDCEGPSVFWSNTTNLYILFLLWAEGWLHHTFQVQCLRVQVAGEVLLHWSWKGQSLQSFYGCSDSLTRLYTPGVLLKLGYYKYLPTQWHFLSGVGPLWYLLVVLYTKSLLFFPLVVHTRR